MIGYTGETLSKCLKVLVDMPESAVDGGYTGENFANGVRDLIGDDVEVVKRNELHTFVVLPKRWIVERTFAFVRGYHLPSALSHQSGVYLFHT